jgi:hypothetical protein
MRLRQIEAVLSFVMPAHLSVCQVEAGETVFSPQIAGRAPRFVLRAEGARFALSGRQWRLDRYAIF